MLDAPGFPLPALEDLQGWQRERFSRTYADFLARESDAAACRFFLDELYGGLEFRERNEDVSRVAPVMARTLPDYWQRFEAVSADYLAGRRAEGRPSAAFSGRERGSLLGRLFGGR